MRSAVHIVDMSAVTPVGLTPESVAAAVRGGISRIAEHPFMVDADGDPLKCAWVPTVPANVLGPQRLVQLGEQALFPLLARLTELRLPTLTVHLALPEGRPGFSETDRKQVLHQLSAAATPIATIKECGRGHAGAMLGLQQALASVERDSDMSCVVGGVDSYFEADTLDWLDSDRRLARATTRGGFPPGEGAAFVVLVSRSLRAQLRLPALGGLRGAFVAMENRDETAPEGLLGEAMTKAYFAAGSTLLAGERFDDLYCDINDERARTTDLGFALLRAGDLLRDGTAYVTPVGSTGDVGAASVPLNCILATKAWSRAYAHGPMALLSGASWGRLRAAAVVEEGEAG